MKENGVESINKGFAKLTSLYFECGLQEWRDKWSKTKKLNKKKHKPKPKYPQWRIIAFPQQKQKEVINEK